MDARDHLSSAKKVDAANDKVKGSLDDIGKAGKRSTDGLNQSKKGTEKLTEANEELADKVDDSTEAVDKFDKKNTKASSSAGKSAAKYIALGAAIATGVGYAFLDAAREAENYQLRLNRLLGSQAEGNRLFSEMTKFASSVPFAYQEIMASATQLAGVMSGGVDEINQWMPMIADLAAVSGLSIEQTTEQVARMYSAGAGAADLFRERGISSMLGFQAGVSYSAEETKAVLIQAYEEPAIRFRGAALDMADSWDGLMSMMGDKWFGFRTNITDEGVFEYVKELAKIINEELGVALDDSESSAEDWANTTISAIGSIIGAGASLLDFFDVFLNGVDQINNSLLTMAQIGTNIESIGLHYEKLKNTILGNDDFAKYQNRMLVENEAFLAKREAQIAQNNLNILERSNRDWSSIADGIIARAEQAAAGAQAANDTIVEGNKDKNEKIIKQDAAATKAAIKLLEKQEKAAERSAKKHLDLTKRKLDSIIKATDTEREKVEKWYRDSVAGLEEAERLKLESVESYARLRERVNAEYSERLEDVTEQETKDHKEAMKERLEQSGVFGKELAELYDDWSGDWTDLLDSNSKLFTGSTEEIFDAWENLLLRMVAQWAISGLAGLLAGDGWSGFNSDAFFGTGGGNSQNPGIISLLTGGANNTSGGGPTGGGTSPNSGNATVNSIGESLGLSETQTQGIIQGAAAAYGIYTGYQQLRNGNEVGGALSIANGGIEGYNAYQSLTGGQQLGGNIANGIGAAGNLYGIYSGIEQGGVGGYGSAAYNSYQLYQRAQSFGLLGGTASNAGSALSGVDQTFQVLDLAGGAGQGLSTGANVNNAANAANTANTANNANGVSAFTSSAGFQAASLWIAAGTLADQYLNDGRVANAFGVEYEGRRQGWRDLGDGDVGGFLSSQFTAPYDAIKATFAARSSREILQQDYLPDLLGENGNSAAGNNSAIFGANFGIQGSGLNAQFLADAGENGNGGFITGAQSSLDGFEAMLNEAGFGMVKNEGGVLKFFDKDKNVADVMELWNTFNDGLDAAVAYSAIFETSVKEGLLSMDGHTKLFIENFALGFGQSYEEATASIVAIDAAFDEMVVNGMSGQDALFQSIGDHYGIAIEDAQFFVEQSGVSTQQWLDNLKNASGEGLTAMLQFNDRGVTIFEDSAVVIEESMNDAVDGIQSSLDSLEGYMANIDLGQPEPIHLRVVRTTENRTGGGGGVRSGADQQNLQSFMVGTPRLESDGPVYAHKGEAIFDPQATAYLQKYGIQMHGGGSGASDQAILKLISELRMQNKKTDKILTFVKQVAAGKGIIYQEAA